MTAKKAGKTTKKSAGKSASKTKRKSVPKAVKKTRPKSKATRASGEKLRLGFVGVRGIANAHMRGLAHRSDVEYVAACDIDEEALATFKEQWGFQQTYTDWKEMLAKADLDAVSVCTPNFLHYQPTLDALRAGCHVMIEKPLAMNAKEGQKMVDEAAKAGKELVIGFQHRFNPMVQMIRDYRDQGALGDILYARVWALRRRGIPNWGMFVRKDLQGGGPMIDIGVHAIEMAHYAMGCPAPVSAVGQTYTYLGDKDSHAVKCSWAGWDHSNYTVEDLATGYVRFDNGATMTIEASFAAHIGTQGMDFTLMGTEGGASLSDGKIFRDQGGYMVDVTPAWLPKNEMFKVKMDGFVDCVLHGQPNLAPGEHGLMVQKILDAVYASAEAGKEIAIK